MLVPVSGGDAEMRERSSDSNSSENDANSHELVILGSRLQLAPIFHTVSSASENRVPNWSPEFTAEQFIRDWRLQKQYFIEALRAIRDSSNIALSQANTQIDSANQKHEKSLLKIEKLQEKLAVQKQETSSKISQWSEDIIRGKQIIGEKEADNKDLSSKIESMEHTVEQANKSFENLRIEHVALQADHLNMKRELDTQSDVVTRSQDRVRRRDAQIDAINKELNSYKSQIEEYRTQLSSDRSIPRVEFEIQHQQAVKLERENITLRAETARLTKMLTDSQQSTKNGRLELDKLQRSHDKFLLECHEANTAVEQRLKNMTVEALEHKEEIQNLTTMTYNQNTVIKDLRVEIDRLKNAPVPKEELSHQDILNNIRANSVKSFQNYARSVVEEKSHAESSNTDLDVPAPSQHNKRSVPQIVHSENNISEVKSELEHKSEPCTLGSTLPDANGRVPRSESHRSSSGSSRTSQLSDRISEIREEQKHYHTQLAGALKSLAGAIDTNNNLRNFTGDKSEDVDEWLEYISDLALSSEWSQKETLKNALKALQGKAYKIVRTLSGSPVKSFKDLKKILLDHFGVDDPKKYFINKLSKAKQGSSERVKNYIVRFKDIIRKLKKLPDTSVSVDNDYLINQFESSLLSEVRVEMLSFSSTSLSMSYKEAIEAEKRMKKRKELEDQKEGTTDKQDSRPAETEQKSKHKYNKYCDFCKKKGGHRTVECFKLKRHHQQENQGPQYNQNRNTNARNNYSRQYQNSQNSQPRYNQGQQNSGSYNWQSYNGNNTGCFHCGDPRHFRNKCPQLFRDNAKPGAPPQNRSDWNPKHNQNKKEDNQQQKK
jgi:hypothetical protein